MQYAIIDGETQSVDVVTLDAVPTLYALYNHDEQSVAAWVVDVPNDKTYILVDGMQVHANLSSAATFWAAALDAELVAATTPAGLN